ncbi:MAG: hypothetical protein P4L57_02150 [Rhizomicrobium sp.]|nr:hypothetical protein [Rhizomicrobium sp.]
MRNTIRVLSICTAMSLSLAAAASAQTYTACSAKTWPGLTFGPNVPTYSVGSANNACYCGVWTGVTPQQAMQAGWYASCNSGKGICNYSPGTRASNQVCGPFATTKPH